MDVAILVCRQFFLISQRKNLKGLIYSFEKSTVVAKGSLCSGLVGFWLGSRLGTAHLKTTGLVMLFKKGTHWSIKKMPWVLVLTIYIEVRAELEIRIALTWMLTRLDCPIIFFSQKDKIKGRGLMWCTCHALSLSLRISLSQTERSSPQQSIADPGWRSDQNREKKCTNLMGPVRKSSLKMVLYHKPSREKNIVFLATSLSRPPYFWDLSRFVFRHEGQYLCRVAW